MNTFEEYKTEATTFITEELDSGTCFEYRRCSLLRALRDLKEVKSSNEIDELMQLYNVWG